jgi:3-oxoacyl-[acyl-carrier-protein] synthase III
MPFDIEFHRDGTVHRRKRRLGEAKVIIRSIALRTPSRCVTNEDIVRLIHAHNSESPSSEVSDYCAVITKLLRKSGAHTRYFRDKQQGERAFDLLIDAVQSAISDAGLSKSKIDLIIYCGVGRGFLEPANAAFVAKAVGLSCDTFDVSEACMSWVRSLQLAYNLLAMRSYRDILVVNAEFNVYEHGIPNIFAICSPDRLKYSFAALTVGEAATATVLASSPKKWKFRFRSAPELAPLCNLPLPGFEEFCGADVRLGLNGTHQLVSFGSELSKAAVRQMIAFVNDTYANVDGIDLWLPHAASEANFRLIARKVGVGERLYTKVFRRYGNLISASIPAAIVMAQQDGMLRRGNRIVMCPATAGMAFGLVEGEY